MAVTGENSLLFKSGFDNSQLLKGKTEAVNIVSQMASQIAKINPFLGLATASVTAFALISKEAYAMAKEFEHAMKEVETISEATQDNFDKIASKVFAISKISPDSPKELAEAYYQIVSAGYDGAEGLKLLEIASRGATAGVTTTKIAGDGLTTVMNAYKLSMEDAEQVSDVFFNTVKLGKTTFSELADNISTVAPLASASGIAFEEIASATASLTKQGVPTAQAMTQIRSSINALNEKLSDGWSESLTFQEGLQLLYDKANGSKSALLELTGRVEGMSAVLGLAGANLQSATADLETYKNVAGATSKAQKTLIGDTTNQWKIFSNNLKAVTKDLGDSWLGVSSSLAKGLNTLFDNSLEGSRQLKESFDEQRIKVFELKGEINRLNVESDERKELIKEMRRLYPEFLNQIDEEKVSNGELLTILDKVNESYKAKYKYQKRILELQTEEENQADIEIVIEDIEGKFNSKIAKLRKIADESNVKINVSDPDFNYDSIVGFIKELRGAEKEVSEFNTETGKEFSNTLNSLARNYIDAEKLNKKLNEQSGIVDGLRERNDKLFKKDLSNAEKRLEAIDKINKSLSVSDISKYENTGYDEITKAYTSRVQVIETLETISNAKKLSDLKIFLASENKEIGDAALKRKKALEIGVIDPDKDKYKAIFEKQYAEKEKQYKLYDAFLRNGDSKQIERAKNTYGIDYANFQEYLRAKSKEAKISTEELSVIFSKMKLPKYDNSDNIITENIGNMIFGDLIGGWKRADDQIERNEAEHWDKMNNINQFGTNELVDLYENANIQIGDMTNDQLKDYIQFWRKKLEIAEKKGDKLAILEAQGVIQNAQREKWAYIINEVTTNLDKVSKIFRDFGDDVTADILDSLAGMSDGLNNFAKAMTSKSGSFDSYSSAVQGVIDLVSIVATATAQRRDAEEEYYNSVLSFQKQYNQLLNEQILIQDGQFQNIFTIDYINTLENGIEALKRANSEYSSSLTEVLDGQAKIGTQSATDWGAVGEGAVAGATAGAVVGSVIPVIGTAIGAAVGGIIGGLVGLFGGKKEENIWGDLLTKYPELIKEAEDGQRSFNSELAQSLINQDLLNDKTKIAVQDALDWVEAVKGAQEQIKGVVEQLAGGLGDNLRNDLVSIFEEGGDAVVKMGETISEVLENVLEQLIFDQIFSQQFQKLQDEMINSFDTQGDRDWVDDFSRFFEASKKLTGDFNQALADAQSQADGFDFNLWSDNNKSDPNSLSGAIKNITEDTANVLAGSVNAIRIGQLEGLDIARSSFEQLERISDNTAYNKHLKDIANTLEDIDTKLG